MQLSLPSEQCERQGEAPNAGTESKSVPSLEGGDASPYYAILTPEGKVVILY